jgi:hypothetical protein
MAKTEKHLIEAHKLISGRAKLRRKAHGKAEYRHLEEVRELFEDKNIVGLGIAEKVTDEKRTGEMCLCFYVEKKHAKGRLRNNKIIPSVLSVGGRSVVTDVRGIGIVRSQNNAQLQPLQSGYSVSHVDAPNAGTVGALVKSDNRFYVLSNSHVLALAGNAQIGENIIYPGRFDAVGKQVVATLADFVPFKNTLDKVNLVDAALAKIDDAFLNKINFNIVGAVSPLDVTEPVVNNKIIANGRVSGRVESTIRDVHFSIVIKVTGIGKIGFTEQVCCDPYSDVGDSGSIIVDKSSRNIVGLHIAGSDKISIFTPINSVQKALDTKFTFVDF